MFKMEVYLLQLIKDRIPSLEKNEVVCKLLDYFLKENYSSNLFILDHGMIKLEDGTYIDIYNDYR